jgi:RNA polymerase sigma-70 factor, ECF subfamily
MPESAPQASDEALMGSLRSGDPAALRELMERHRRPLYGYLQRLLASAEDAEDLFQETFLRVVRHAQRFDTSRSFKPWLYSIATNLVKNTYRSRGYRQALSLDAGGPDEEAGPSLLACLEDRGRQPQEAAVLGEAGELVRAAIADLPEKGRVALVLYYYQGVPYEEIARSLDVPLGTVKSRIHNAMAKLAQLLTERRARARAESEANR